MQPREIEDTDTEQMEDYGEKALAIQPALTASQV